MFGSPDMVQYINVWMPILPRLYFTLPLNLSPLQVEKSGDMVTPPLDLTVMYPDLSPRKNRLLYLTHVATSPKVHTHTCGHASVSEQTDPPSYLPLLSLQVKCDTADLINPLKINPKVEITNINKETLSVFLLVSEVALCVCIFKRLPI